MNYETILLSILGMFGGILGGGWYARRKARLDAEGTAIANNGSEIHNIKDIIELYKESFTDIKSAFDLKYDIVIEQYGIIKQENAEMRDELSKLRNVVSQNTQMQKEIEQLQLKVKALEVENAKLKCDLKKLQP